MPCKAVLRLNKFLIYTGAELKLEKPVSIIYGVPGSGKSLLVRLFTASLAPAVLSKLDNLEPSKAAAMLGDLFPGLGAGQEATIDVEAGMGTPCRLTYHVSQELGAPLGTYRIGPFECARGGIDTWPFLVLPALEERLWLVRVSQLSLARGAGPETCPVPGTLAARYYALLFREASSLSEEFRSKLQREAERLLGSRKLTYSPAGAISVDGVPLYAESSTTINLLLAAFFVSLAKHRAHSGACSFILLDLPEHGLTQGDKGRLVRALAELAVEASDNVRIVIVTHDYMLPGLLLLRLNSLLSSSTHRVALGDYVEAYEVEKTMDGPSIVKKLRTPYEAPDYIRRGLQEIIRDARSASMFPLSTGKKEEAKRP